MDDIYIVVPDCLGLLLVLVRSASSSRMVAKQTVLVGGIEVFVFSPGDSEMALRGHGEDEGLGLARKDMVAFFLLHGRTGSAERTEPLARSIVERCEAKEKDRGRELLVITFVSDRLGPQGRASLICFFSLPFWFLVECT